MATVIDFAILTLMNNIFGIHYALAAFVGFTVSTIFNYNLSMKYVFKSRYAKHKKQEEFRVFVILSIIGLVINQGLLVLAVEYLGLTVIVSKIGVTACVMVFNFVSRKIFIEGRGLKSVKKSSR